jgi:hypothetical protein
MSPYSDPASDPVLLNLKQLALRGGERGPLCDRGVLVVIDQIERQGNFTPDHTVGLLLLLSLQMKTNSRMLNDDELAEADRFLSERGWNLEQGLEYVSGIDLAEKLLFRFKRDDGQA